MKNIVSFLFCISLVGCGSKKVAPSKGESTVQITEEVKDAVLENAEFSGDVSQKQVEMSKSTKHASSKEIEETMRFLASDELQGRDSGSEGSATAAAYIINEFKKNGVKPYFKYYRDTLSNFKKGTAFNVVGVIPGNDSVLKNQFILLGAHYDHIGLLSGKDGDKIANGANDNASGTTTVLQLAKYFGANKGNRRSILFTLYTAEEKGLLGSKHLAEKLKAEGLDLYAMLNFEMVGVPMNNKDHSLYLTGYKLSNLAEVSNRYANKNLVGFLQKAKELNLFRRSDNAPFHDAFNVPSQTYSSFDFTNFNHYHKVGDEVEKMDFEFMANIVNDLIPMVVGIANAETREIKYN